MLTQQALIQNEVDRGSFLLRRRGDLVTKNAYGAAGGLDPAGEKAEDGRLAGALVSQETEHLSLAHGEADAIHRQHVVVLFPYAVDLNQWAAEP
jgi:hypothetical protein